MNRYHLSEEELQTAKDFFYRNDIETLTAQAIKINKSQPNFSAMVLAMEMHGLDRVKVGECRFQSGNRSVYLLLSDGTQITSIFLSALCVFAVNNFQPLYGGGAGNQKTNRHPMTGTQN